MAFVQKLENRQKICFLDIKCVHKYAQWNIHSYMLYYTFMILNVWLERGGIIKN